MEQGGSGCDNRQIRARSKRGDCFRSHALSMSNVQADPFSYKDTTPINTNAAQDHS